MGKASALDKSYGMDSLELIKKICSLYGIQVTVGKSVVGSKIEKGGFPLVHMSPLDAIKYLTNMCTCNTKKG